MYAQAVKCFRWAAKCSRWAAKCSRWAAKCFRWAAKCSRWAAKCSRWAAKCSRWAVNWFRWAAKWFHWAVKWFHLRLFTDNWLRGVEQLCILLTLRRPQTATHCVRGPHTGTHCVRGDIQSWWRTIVQCILDACVTQVHCPVQFATHRSVLSELLLSSAICYLIIVLTTRTDDSRS